jgi:hypothetical protein
MRAASLLSFALFGCRVAKPAAAAAAAHRTVSNEAHTTHTKEEE